MRGHAIDAANLPRPIAQYSPGMRAGDFVFVAGQVGVDPVTGDVVGDDIRSQTRRAIGNIELILKEAGGGLEDVVRVFAYLAELDDYPGLNDVYGELMPQPYPPRSAVYVRMPRNLKVQIEVTALIPQAAGGH